jgi:hypothetical protein
MPWLEGLESQSRRAQWAIQEISRLTSHDEWEIVKNYGAQIHPLI